MELISKTDMKCVWNKRKKDALKVYAPVPLLDTPCLQKHQGPKIEMPDLNEEVNDELRKILITALPDSALARFR